MKEIVRVAGINLLIVLAYVILFWLVAQDELGILIALLVAVWTQIGVNIVLAIVFLIKGKSAYGKALLLFGLVPLIIGLSFCFGAI